LEFFIGQLREVWFCRKLDRATRQTAVFGPEVIGVAEEILRQEDARRYVAAARQLPEIPAKCDAPFCLAALHRLEELGVLAATLDRFSRHAEPRGNLHFGALHRA
jgi:hypothetical protein